MVRDVVTKTRSAGDRIGWMRRPAEQARGVKAAGGGRKDAFRPLKNVVKSWAAVERQNGQPVDTGYLRVHFMWVLQQWLQAYSTMEDRSDDEEIAQLMFSAGIMLHMIKRLTNQGFSDQVPWRGLVGQEKQLYLEDELKTAAGKKWQCRGFDNDEAKKFRVTMELRQLKIN